MQTRGPEGEQEVRDEKGKRVSGGMSVKFVGHQQYIRELMGEAGLIDPELEEIVDKLKGVEASMRKLERFFGMAGAVIES